MWFRCGSVIMHFCHCLDPRANRSLSSHLLASSSAIICLFSTGSRKFSFPVRQIEAKKHNPRRSIEIPTDFNKLPFIFSTFLGTNERGIIDILGNRTSAERVAIRDAYPSISSKVCDLRPLSPVHV